MNSITKPAALRGKQARVVVVDDNGDTVHDHTGTLARWSDCGDRCLAVFRDGWQFWVDFGRGDSITYVGTGDVA